MTPLRRWIAPAFVLARDSRGQDLIEYALMARFVSVCAAAALPAVAQSFAGVLGRVCASLDSLAAMLH